MKKAILLFFSLSITIMIQATNPNILSVVSTAGNLSQAITNAGGNLNTITDLTVTGTIDARDFLTMRDNMPVLSALNLSAVTISSYTGTGGTKGSTSTSYVYAANVIPSNAFYNINLEYPYNGKKSLTSVTIPSSVTSIESGAFECSGLTSITIPPSVTSIGNLAFYSCISLRSVTLPSSVTSIGHHAFWNCFNLPSITIPSSVTSIGVFAFEYCAGLTSITIPPSVTRIESYTFSNCTNLTSITIPSSVTYIGESAFVSCSGLTSITIPSSVTYIGGGAFSGCSGLTSITIPSSVTDIGGGAFDCSNLTSIYAHSNIPVDLSTYFSNTVFRSVNNTTCILYVPTNSIDLYKAAYQWSDFTNILGMTGTVSLSGLTATYDGTPKTVTATTIPTGLSVDITYNGLNTAPTAPGTYLIVATINDANYQGSTTDSLVISDTNGTINTENSQINIISYNDIIKISGVKIGNTISVYTLNGSLLFKTKTTKETEYIYSLENGVYIVTIYGENICRKILVH